MSIVNRLGRLARSVVSDVTRQGRRRLQSGVRDALRGGSSDRSRGSGRQGGSTRSGSGPDGGRHSGGGHPSPLDVGRAEQRRLDVVTEFDTSAGLPELTYSPREDERPDPGEVVWAWVPYDEDDGQGKDRPVLVLARLDGGVHTDRHGRSWIDVGTGDWDSQGRESEVRLDRLLRLPDGSVRREGAALDREHFGRVTDALESRY